MKIALSGLFSPIPCTYLSVRLIARLVFLFPTIFFLPPYTHCVGIRARISQYSCTGLGALKDALPTEPQRHGAPGSLRLSRLVGCLQVCFLP